MTIDEYAAHIPREIRKAVKALGHDIRCAIVVDLTQKDELTFTQLKEDLNIDPGLLSSHLKILMEGAVVEHYYRHELGNEQYSYYGITLFGKDLLRGILEPLRKIQPSRKPLGKSVSTIGTSFPSTTLIFATPACLGSWGMPATARAEMHMRSPQVSSGTPYRYARKRSSIDRDSPNKEVSLFM